VLVSPLFVVTIQIHFTTQGVSYVWFIASFPGINTRFLVIIIIQGVPKIMMQTSGGDYSHQNKLQALKVTQTSSQITSYHDK